mmetsp:Transcript_4039/g.9446  ORF Transcript_4039/g.9446 Transcript_4039/m.9446 type:complete len:81 (+) Transcript_4039:2-244(+)
MSMRGMASSVGQHNLVMETKMLRRSQREQCLILMERLDAVADRVHRYSEEAVMCAEAARASQPRKLSRCEGEDVHSNTSL